MVLPHDCTEQCLDSPAGASHFLPLPVYGFHQAQELKDRKNNHSITTN